MRLVHSAVAAGLLLTGCASKNKSSHVTVPANSLQPVMQRQVLNAIDAGEGNPRVRALRAQMASQPNNVRPRLELAEEFSKTGYPELELEHLRLAVERFPESEDALVALSKALVRSNAAAEAEKCLDTFIAKHEKPSATVLSWAGIVKDSQNKWTEGEPLHRRAVERAPGRDTLHNNLGYNLMMQGRKSDAVHAFRQALELNPSSETARNNLGLSLGDQPADAISQFRQTSDMAVAHNNLAAYLYEKGDLAGARKELELALAYRKDMPQILDNLRNIAALDGKPIQMPHKEPSSFWKTFARGLKRTFDSGEQKQPTLATEAGR